MIEAAGILFVDDDNKILLLKRSAEGDHAREWALPGGKLEAGETVEQAAHRELSEECGMDFDADHPITQIMHTDDGNVAYTTFLAECGNFTPILNSEHTGFMWCDVDDIPNKTHPGVKALLSSDSVKKAIFNEEIQADSVGIVTETDIAKQMRDKKLTSPQRYSNVTLFALRISGTGVSYRSKLDEYVNRLPDNYLTDDFLSRCNGLPVIWIHPENDKLDSVSFAERVIGTICLPYIEGDEVWGIAKIWDDEAAQRMQGTQMSTSPGVVFTPGTNIKMQMQDGSHVLIEGNPSLLDHLAIVENGVWDKGGAPSGVLLEPAHVEMTEASRNDSADQTCSTLKESNMADAIETPAANPENEMLTLLKSVAAKIEGLEERLAAIEAAEIIEAGDTGEVKPYAALPSPTLPVPGAPEAPKVDAAPVAPTAEPAAYVADKARMDAMAKEIETLKANSARQDNAEEAAKFAEAQGRADAVEQAYGDSAPRPLSGDTVLGYEKRMVQKHLARSKRWSNVNVSAITDPAAFAVIRDDVYADSMAAAANCEGVPHGQIVARTKDTGTGHKVTEYHGKTSFISQFAPPKMASVINRKPA